MYEKIVSLCKDRGISIRKLEVDAGLTIGTVWHWRHTDPSVSKLKAVADYFGCTVDELICSDEEANERSQA